MTIDDFLRQAAQQFEQAGITSPRLDAQVLLGRALKQNKAWLLAHGEDMIAAEKLPVLLEQTQRRIAREPLAYITGFQEFYGRRFAVTSNVLIPRPETEEIIEQLKALPLPNGATMLDVGTGSGAIAVATALEMPDVRVQACDISPEALEIAEQNAERLGAQNIRFFVSDLLSDVHQTYDVIAANLPYVSPDWERSPETQFEPKLALFADDNGLKLIKKLITQAPNRLNKKGYLLLEADPRQHNAITEFSQQNGLQLITKQDFIVTLQKD